MPQTKQIPNIRPSYDGSYNSYYPDGDKPDVSRSGGTLEALAWSAPQGLVDGGDLIITSNTHTFYAPDKLIYLGFGTGWLYDRPDESNFVGHTVQTITGAESFIYENGEAGARKVKTVDGIKYLYTDFYSDDNPTRNRALFINYDTGNPLAPGDKPFMYRVSRMTVGQGSPAFQWKAERMGMTANLGTGNDGFPSIYVKNTESGPSIDSLNGGGDATGYYFSTGLNKLGNVTMCGIQWLQNTPDVADGGITIIGSVAGETYSREIPTNSGGGLGNGIITSDTPNRPRWLKVQDYIGNRDPDTPETNIELWTTDFYWSVNGSMFVIADSSDLYTAELWTPVVPVSVSSSKNEWTLRLWRGQLGDYVNKYLFLLDDDLNVVDGVAL